MPFDGVPNETTEALRILRATLDSLQSRNHWARDFDTSDGRHCVGGWIGVHAGVGLGERTSYMFVSDYLYPVLSGFSKRVLNTSDSTSIARANVVFMFNDFFGWRLTRRLVARAIRRLERQNVST